MLIRYFTAKEEYANRTRNLIPRKGDEIRFNGAIYAIKKIVWIEDEVSECVHVLIEEIANKEKDREWTNSNLRSSAE